MFVRLNKDLKVGETKPSIVKQQCVAYKFYCYLCDEGQVDTSGHLYERVDSLLLQWSSLFSKVAT